MVALNLIDLQRLGQITSSKALVIKELSSFAETLLKNFQNSSARQKSPYICPCLKSLRH
jgi:hypothetical protein